MSDTPRIELSEAMAEALGRASQTASDLNEFGCRVRPVEFWDGTKSTAGLGIVGWEWQKGEHSCGLRPDEAARLRDFLCEHLGLPAGAKWEKES